MAKSRFTTADTKAMVRDIRATILGQRVANIYDINEKTYLFKFAVPGNNDKVLLLMESGIRFHTTTFVRDKNDMPSPFAMRLRKCIRTKRLEDIRQIATDRVVDFKFGSGEGIFHIILELYANGNIILTDGNYEVLALLRSHQFAEDVAVKVGEIYPIAFATSMELMKTRSTTADSGSDHILGETLLLAANMDAAGFRSWAAKKEAESNAWQTQPSNATSKAAKKSKTIKMNMRQLLLLRDSGMAPYGPEIIDHCLLSAGVKPALKVSEFFATEEAAAMRLLEELREAQGIMALLDTPGQPGYILYNEESQIKEVNEKQELDRKEKEGKESLDLLPTDFVPRIFRQHEGKAMREFPSFNEAVDEYFCKIEEQRLQKQAQSAEEAAKKKIEKVREEQKAMVHTLEKQQKRMEQGAALVELFAEDVDKCTMVINSALTAGMSWEDIGDMVDTETAAGNPIAALVARLRLDRNIIVLRLRDLFNEEDEEEDGGIDEDADGNDDDTGEEQSQKLKNKEKNENGDNEEEKEKKEKEDDVVGLLSKSARKKLKKGKGPVLSGEAVTRKDDKINKKKKSSSGFIEVEIDLNMTAHANACRMYSHKKSAHAKEVKTLQAAEKVLQSVEAQSIKNLEAQKIKRNLQAVRKVHWFEKFNWFISSEGYLILSGRDAQQNEAIVKRYMRPGDAYVHADIHGAASCVVRCKMTAGAKPGDSAIPKPISPFALQEAGAMTCCRSGAWGAKVVTSAWWVWGSQVSKTAPTGEYLSTGSFMIYGKKNYLPPMPLEMGFGIMFRLDDASVVRHTGERKDRSVCFEETESVLSEAASRYGIEFEGLGLREKDSDDEEEEEVEVEDGGREEDMLDEKIDRNVQVGYLGPIAEDTSDEEEEEGEEGEGTANKEKISGTQGFSHGKSDIAGVYAAVEAKDMSKNVNKEEDKYQQLILSAQGEESAACTAVAGRGRLTAKERREMKKMKAKGRGQGTADMGSMQIIGDQLQNLEINEKTNLKSKGVVTETGVDENDDAAGEQADTGSDDDNDNDGDSGEGKAPPPHVSGESVQITSQSSGANDVDNRKNKAGKDKSAGNNKPHNKDAVSSSAPTASSKKAKHLSKKKARRYADQDEEDRQLAMQALGHGEKASEREARARAEKTQKDRAAKQAKVGVNLAKKDWVELLTPLPASVREVIDHLVSSGQMKEGEIDSYEINALASFGEGQALTILELFRDGNNLRKVGNKSGFLAGIMRRFSKEAAKVRLQDSAVVGTGTEKEQSEETHEMGSAAQVEVSEADKQSSTEAGVSVSEGGDADAGSETAMSRRERKKREQLEIQAILEEEGVLDEEEGKQADELEKLTGRPLDGDALLYAVPVCGPYASLSNFKYRVKLTPGTQKKGKAAKQAIELFTHSRECPAAEKMLIKGLSDPEMVAIMIGDVKLSVPGLFSMQQKKKGGKARR